MCQQAIILRIIRIKVYGEINFGCELWEATIILNEEHHSDNCLFYHSVYLFMYKASYFIILLGFLGKHVEIKELKLRAKSQLNPYSLLSPAGKVSYVKTLKAKTVSNLFIFSDFLLCIGVLFLSRLFPVSKRLSLFTT